MSKANNPRRKPSEIELDLCARKGRCCVHSHDEPIAGESVGGSASPFSGKSPSIDLIADLVLANHILFDQGVVDGFGHVSVRHDKYSNRFLLVRSMAPLLVQAEDIIEYDLDSNPLNANGRKSYVERFIHSEIYRARPDVVSIVHSHSDSVISFGVSSVGLRPVFHMGGFLTNVKKYDIRVESGRMTDTLVSDRDLGHSLAKTLGEAPVALMRGHGSVAVGASLQEAVFRAVYTEINAKIQAQAISLGGTVEYLSIEEGELATRSCSAHCGRTWELWKRDALAIRGK